jgi:WD40 repeat protein/tRNA A-37 threonylcarbamoyl transferase component Bud32
MSDCPDRVTLAEFLEESTDESRHKTIATHVDTCASCQGLLEQLTALAEAFSAEDALAPANDSSRADSKAQMSADTNPFLQMAHRIWQTSGPAPAATPVTIDQFEDLKEIDHGGMARVYQARDRMLNRLVAIKVLLSGEFASERERTRLRNEAQLIALLRHPQIVELFGVGETQGQPYLVLEFMPGGMLADRLRDRSYSPREAAELVRVLAEGIQAAHDQGIVHRDLKPANVLFTSDGRPKIADFGIAKRGEEGVTHSGDILGSIDYMAPEQVRGKAVGPEADIYALGGILYALLTGNPPFWAVESGEKLNAICHQDPIAPKKLDQAIPRDLETICLKALEKEKSRRFESAREMADELHRWLNHLPLNIHPPSVTYRMGRWVHRHRALAVVCGISAMLICGVTAFAGYRVLIEARTIAEVRIRALIAMAHTQLQSPINDKIDKVRNLLIPEITNQRKRLGSSNVFADLDHALRSLVLAEKGKSGILKGPAVTLPDTQNLAWPAAIHPAGHAAVVAGPDRPYRFNRGETVEFPAEVKNVLPAPRVWFSATGKYVVHARGSGELTLWDESATQQLAAWKLGDAPACTVLAFAFAGDIVEDEKQTIRLFLSDGSMRWLSVPMLKEDSSRKKEIPSTQGDFMCAEYSHDASQLAVGDDKGNITIFDTSGQEIRRISIDKQPVYNVCWSPDSNFLASGARSGAVLIHDLKHRELLHRIGVDNLEPKGMFFTPDGRSLCVRCRGTVFLDVKTGERLQEVNSAFVGCSTDGRRFLDAHGRGIAFWDWQPPEAIVTCIGHRYQAMQTAWAANSRRFASIDNSFELCVFDATDGRLLQRARLPSGDWYSENGGLALDEHGEFACVAYARGEKGIAYFLKVATGELVGPVALSTTGFMRLAYSRETNRFLLLCDEQGNPEKWNLRTVICELAPGHDPAPVEVLRPPVPGEKGDLDHQLTPDGRFYAWVGPRVPETARRTEIWDVERRVRVEQIPQPGPEEAAAFLSANGRHVWTSLQGAKPSTDGPTVKDNIRFYRTAFRPSAVSHDDKWMIARHTGSETTILPAILSIYRFRDESPLFDIFDGPDPTSPHPMSIFFSPDGRFAIWGESSGHVMRLDLRALEPIVEQVRR